MSYPKHSFGGRVLPPAEMQSVYSTAPGDWTTLEYIGQFVTGNLCLKFVFCDNAPGIQEIARIFQGSHKFLFFFVLLGFFHIFSNHIIGL